MKSNSLQKNLTLSEIFPVRSPERRQWLYSEPITLFESAAVNVVVQYFWHFQVALNLLTVPAYISILCMQWEWCLRSIDFMAYATYKQLIHER